MNVCISVCAYACSRVYVCKYVCVHMCVCRSVCTCVCMYACLCMHIYVYACLCICVCMYLCLMYACVYVQVCHCICMPVCACISAYECVLMYACVHVPICIHGCMSMAVHVCACMYACLCVHVHPRVHVCTTMCQVAGFPSWVRVNHTPFYMYPTFSPPFHPLRDIWVVSTSCLLSTVLQWMWERRELLELPISAVLGQILGCGTTGSYGSYSFNFWRNFCTIGGCTVLHSKQQCTRVQSFSTY